MLNGVALKKKKAADLMEIAEKAQQKLKDLTAKMKGSMHEEDGGLDFEDEELYDVDDADEDPAAADDEATMLLSSSVGRVIVLEVMMNNRIPRLRWMLRGVGGRRKR